MRSTGTTGARSNPGGGLSYEDPRLETYFLSGLADLTTYDIKEARAFVEKNNIEVKDFTRSDHWTYYEAICRCIALGIPCEQDNFIRELKALGCENVIAASAILGQALGSALEGYSAKLRELSERRHTVVLLKDSLSRLERGEDTLEVRTILGNRLTHTRGRKVASDLNTHLDAAEEHIRKVRAGQATPVLQTGIPDLDAVIGGWQSTLNLIGAEPGVGKSALFASTVHAIAARNVKVAIFSLEDVGDWLAYRLLSHKSNVNQHEMRFRKTNDAEFKKISASRLDLLQEASNILVVDGSDGGMRIEDIVATSNDLILNHGVKAIFIDHLGEILSSQSDRYDLEITRHLSLLRGVANRHGVPMVVAAHLRRQQVDLKSGMPLAPRLSDFANSSGAERKARVALGLARKPGSDVMSIHVLKQTNGPAGQVVDVRFHGAAAMIMDIEGGIQ